MNDNWVTPPEFVKKIYDVLEYISLDPCSTEFANTIIKANTFFTEEQNGLTKTWGGNVYVNPPYSRKSIVEFADKFYQSSVSGDIVNGIFLCNVSTETKWAQKMLNNFDVCFLRGRLQFIDPETQQQSNNNRYAQMVLFYGNNKQKFYNVFSQIGVVLAKVE